jgi:hypothetical protein
VLITIAKWIFYVGSVVELVGLGISLRGFIRTWAEHPTDEEFFAFVSRAVSGGMAGAARLTRRVLGLKPRPTTVQAEAALAWATAGQPRVVIGWGPLPAVDADPHGFAAAVEERLNTLHRTVQDLQHALMEQGEAAKDREDKLKADVVARIAEVEAMTHHVAVGGLRQQVLGWALVVAGFLMQAVSQVMQFIAS